MPILPNNLEDAVCDFRGTEVCQLDNSLAHDQNVLAFDVTMDDIMGMAMEQGQAELPSHLPNLLF